MDHVERRHSIVLSGSIDCVFPLFTPAGEKLWVEGWDPEFLHPTSGEICEGMVFRTSHRGEVTLWACINWSPSAHRVRYARVTPASPLWLRPSRLPRSRPHTHGGGSCLLVYSAEP
jgi:hypothetical protein